MTPNKRQLGPSNVFPGVRLAEIETFIAVAELGSFSKAAERLHLSQPAVTGRVQKLESALGARLLHRTTRKVTLTKAGEHLAACASETLQSLHVLLADLATDKAAARRRVTVACTPMLAATALPRAIRVFVERNPNIQVIVSDLRYTDAISSVQRGEVDLGFLAIEPRHPSLRCECLIEEDLVMVIPGMHPLASETSVPLERFAPYPIMLLEQYAWVREKVAREFAQYGFRFTPTVSAGNLLTLLGMVDAGNGIALLPRFAAQLNAATPRATVAIRGDNLRRRYGIVLRKNAKLSVVARSFCDFLRTEIRHSWPR